jgi:hypothetical protein
MDELFLEYLNIKRKFLRVKIIKKKELVNSGGISDNYGETLEPMVRIILLFLSCNLGHMCLEN